MLTMCTFLGRYCTCSWLRWCVHNCEYVALSQPACSRMCKNPARTGEEMCTVDRLLYNVLLNKSRTCKKLKQILSSIHQLTEAWGLGAFQNAYELLNLRALKIWLSNEMHIFQCMGKIVCVEFQRNFYTTWGKPSVVDPAWVFAWLNIPIMCRQLCLLRVNEVWLMVLKTVEMI